MAYFETFPSEYLPGTVLVRVMVIDYRHVSSGMRWALGVVTGSTSSSHWQGVCPR